MGFHNETEPRGRVHARPDGCPSVNQTHTSGPGVLLNCDSVKLRNVSKLNWFHSRCKAVSVSKPVCHNRGSWGFTPRTVPTIPPPALRAARGF